MVSEQAYQKHIIDQNIEFFNRIEPINWDDLLNASVLTEKILRDLVSDKALFRQLLFSVPNDSYLWHKCEEDIVEDKIVLWDDIDKGLRIRLRMSTAKQERLAHSHRFSFTNLVLRGKYIHWHYDMNEGFDELTNLDDVKEVCMHEDRAGDCFSIHHNALHSTPFIEDGTVSLVLRGNPIKDRAPVMFKEPRRRAEALSKIEHTNQRLDEVEPAVADKGTMFWRVGEKDESPERRQERQMTREKFDFWCKQLEEWGLI